MVLTSGISTYDFSTICIILPHNLKPELIEQTFNRDDWLHLIFKEKPRCCCFLLLFFFFFFFFFHFLTTKIIIFDHVRKFATPSIIVLTAFVFYIYSKLYRNIAGIQIDTNCALLSVDLFLFCERLHVVSLSDNTQADIIESFNSTSRKISR